MLKMPKEKGVPKPAISDELLLKIKEKMNTVHIPECGPLQEYFDAKVMHKEDTFLPTYPKGNLEIRALFPEVALIPNIDKILEYYICHYPGFPNLNNRYYNGTEHSIDQTYVLVHWYKEFFSYLKIKVDDLLQLTNKHKVNTDACTMTENKEIENNEWRISNFSVDITGPSNVINNVVFMKAHEDVVMRYHKSKCATSFNNEGCLNVLFNYPDIEIDLNIGEESPIIAFKRTCECQYDRYIMTKHTSVQQEIYKNSSKTKKNASKLNPCVQSIELVEAKESISYEYSFISEFIRVLLDLIKNCTDRVPTSLKIGLSICLKEFLADIEQLNLYNRKVIATNTAVKFTLGTTKYERYRFVQTSDVNFVEIITPTISLHLKDFNPWYAIDQQQELYFKQLRLYAQNLIAFEDILLKEGVIKFTCKICNECFNSTVGLLNHVRHNHELVHGVVCEKCKLSLQVDALAAKRWHHTCFE